MSPTAQAGAATREAILARAVDLASLEGLEGLTIGRLAAELDMSKSGLFRHFGSKEELQIATVRAAVDVFTREVVEPAAAAETGLAGLRALIEGYIAYLEREVFPGGCFLSAAGAEFDGRPGPVRDAILHASRAWGRELERQAARAIEHGELPDDTDPAQIAFELNALAKGANWVFQLYDDRRAFQRARTAVARRLP